MLSAAASKKSDTEAIYDYVDADGKLKFQVVRFRPEPLRVWRRPFCLSHAAMSDCFSMA